MEQWLDAMLNNKISKEAMDAVGKDAKDTFERKVQAHDWIKGVSDLDPAVVEAEYLANLAAEARMLGKTAAYEMGETPKETVKKDFERDVKILSDYALAEMLAEARGHEAQNTSEMFYELKEKAKAEVASSREKAEKALLDMIPDHTQLDWKKAFEKFTKDATPEQPKEKDLFKSEVPEKAHDFEHPTEEKFKLPKDPEKAIPGNGREADERKEVTQEAGVLKDDIVKEAAKKEHTEDCMDANDDTSVLKGKCICPPEKKEAAMAPDSIEDLASVDKDAAQNQQVIDSFLSGQGGARSTNLFIVKGSKGLVLVNYETPIAFQSANGETYLNNQKYSVTTSSIQNKIRNAAAGKIKEVSPQELEQIMSGPASDPSGAPMLDTVSTQASMIEKKADACPVCGGAGKDLKNGAKENIACEACGITYACASLTASAEIETHASKVEVIKKVAELQKKAEVSSPWIVTTDEHGQEILARVEQPTNVKESEEDKKEEILK